MLTRRAFLGAASASSAALATAASARRIVSKDDPLGVRADFPGTRDSIFFDAAYTALSPQPAINYAQAFLQALGSRPPNVPEMMHESGIVRERFAKLIGATKEEVGLVYATSDGENIITQALNLKPGDNVVIDDLHYRSTYVLYQRLKEELGIEVRIVRNVKGATPPELFAPHVDARTRLVSVSWISHYNGYRQDLQALADLVHAQGGYLYADSIQGIGMLEMDVNKIDVDFLTCGSYKWLLAGYGVAAFYVRKELMALVSPDRSGGFQTKSRTVGKHEYELHTDARKYQYATMSFGAVYHLNAALEYILGVGVKNIERHSVGLATKLNKELVAQGFEMLTPPGNASAIVSFKHGRTGKAVRESLQSEGIYINIGDKKDYLRVGIGLYNNEAEIDRLLKLTASWI
ncbi:MAG: aminotransferase class V-fold PLP-dependent enzyme [Gammaproteobacteria bacterium]|nr:aminotransferase class V-fold PLP-dependent enzyme [Gammaproteobacteria bacterium]